MNTISNVTFHILKHSLHLKILFKLRLVKFSRNKEQEHIYQSSSREYRIGNKKAQRNTFLAQKYLNKRYTGLFPHKARGNRIKRMSYIGKTFRDICNLISKDKIKRNNQTVIHHSEHKPIESGESMVRREIITHVNKINLPDVINIRIEEKKKNQDPFDRIEIQNKRVETNDTPKKIPKPNFIFYFDLTMNEKLILKENSIKMIKKLLSNGKSSFFKIFTPIVEKGKKMIKSIKKKEKDQPFFDTKSKQFTSEGYKLIYDEFIFHVICRIIEYIGEYRSGYPFIFRSCMRTNDSKRLLETVKEDCSFYCTELSKYISRCNDQNVKCLIINQCNLFEIMKLVDKKCFLVTNELLDEYTGSDLAYVCMALIKDRFEYIIDHDTAHDLYNFYSQISEEEKNSTISFDNMAHKFGCMEDYLLNILEPKRREIFVNLIRLFSEIEANYTKSLMRKDALIKSTLDIFFSKKFLFSKNDDKHGLIDFLKRCGRDETSLLEKMKKKMTFSVKFCDYLSTLDSENVRTDLIKK